ncbi:MAG: hypothetical protein KF888_05205 [Nitrosomonas sp.]|nr:hypothetical protein [Nitrosomonas sp.]
MLTDSKSKKKPFADPFEGRFEQSLALLSSNIRQKYHIYITYGIENKVNQVETIKTELKDHVSPYTKNMETLLTNLKNKEDGLELDSQQKDKYSDLKEEVNDLNSQVSQCIRMLEENQSVEVDKVDTIETKLNAIQNCFNALKQKYSDVFETTIKSTNEVSQFRSDKMHEAAESRSGEKGVWKIGDNHRGHLKEKKASYNLVSKNDFNKDFKLYYSQKDGKWGKNTEDEKREKK